ncbi:contractile injection system tape measure protein [Chitinophaga sp. 22321]|uniref:Helicase XPB/Ssl2 N-terminal domain-containing protein n=1 Tax=Chitinophaga hostae TaxID=2831022 RepID=A0ABS5J450_9BACT|nr:contractile injection system tape measure protein [Chitinophaga hostae]MBS0029996.1 hypothetical protein [Chitinophaga hostae]
MSDRQHIIGRMEVQVNASEPLLATQVQQQLGYRLHTAAFMQQLDAVLNEAAGEYEYIEIPTLTVSLECAGEVDFQSQLLQQLAAAIREQVSQRQTAGIVMANGNAYTLAVKQFFLKYGIRAFYNGKDILAALHEEIKELPVKEQPALEQLLKQAGRETPLLWRRLYYLLGAAGIQQFFLRTFGSSEAALELLVIQTLTRMGKWPIASTPAAKVIRDGAAVTTLSPVLSPALLEDALLWEACFRYMLEGNDIKALPAAMVASAPALKKENSKQGITADPEETAIELSAQLQNGLFVENAGLVLLWMECARLFRTLGYVVERQFTDEVAQQRAILLLHYICYGPDVLGSEEDWLLNKLLCGWPPEIPVDPALAPDDAAQQAAREMLAAYLDTWRKDRKFSAAWFSTAFLQREGVLLRRADGAWVLEVSARTEDVLISKVSMVKYAWMPQILYVRW